MDWIQERMAADISFLMSQIEDELREIEALEEKIELKRSFNQRRKEKISDLQKSLDVLKRNGHG